MYPPGFLYETHQARECELERRLERTRLLEQVAPAGLTPFPLFRSLVLRLGQLLEKGGIELQRAAGCSAVESSPRRHRVSSPV
jgi:hypothetical protein